MTNKRKNIVDQAEALELFLGYGLNAKVFNAYQIRIWPEETERFFDWYHTTGTITVIHNGSTTKVREIPDAEGVAGFIIKHIRHESRVG